jgi:hypothetical protein
LRLSIPALIAAFASVLFCMTDAMAKDYRFVETDKAMHFAIVVSDDPGCQPLCPRWIAAQGQITPGTASRFRNFLRSVKDRDLPMVVHSGGGSVNDAIVMGRLIRQRSMKVAVGMTAFDGCVPGRKGCSKANVASFGRASPIRAYCFSACPMILAGGVQRLAGSSSSVGVHQVTTEERMKKETYRITYRVVKGKRKILSRKLISSKIVSRGTTTKLSSNLRKRIVSYYDDMGINPAFFEAGLKTKPKDIYIFRQDVLAELKMVTGSLDANTWTDARTCVLSAPPTHCLPNPRYP